jgi:hypothetical protein
MHVVIPEDVVHEIDALVGKRGRSSFLASIARQEVKRRRLLGFLESPGAVWKPGDHPELERGSAAWVAAARRDDEQRDAARAGRRK